MNRVYDFDDVMPLRRKTAASVMARLAERKKGVAGNRRPRSEDERAMIVRMALVHVRQRRESGELVEVAPRLYELRTGSRER